MKVDGKPTRTIWLEADGWSVGVIDQTQLPHRFVTLRLTTLADAVHAIASMQVRGAPLIGAAFLSKRVDVEVAAYYTAWNVFKELEIVTPNPLTSATLTQNWSPTWAYRLGVAGRLGKALQHEIRVGGVLDETPIPTEYLRPSIPDADRTGYTVGYGWQGKHIGLDVYGMMIEFDDVTANGLLVDVYEPIPFSPAFLEAPPTSKSS